MRRLFVLLLCLCATSLGAQQKLPEGIWEGYDGEWKHVTSQLIALAEATPADKFAFRPSAGVRSTSEVYMHIVTANYGYAKMLGTPYPAGLDSKALVAGASDKTKVIQALKDSFAHMREAILAIKDSDLEKEIKTPRGQTTIRGAFFMISGHYGEHLGQSIAYARSVGIVPPWTEERLKQEGEKPKP